MYKKLLLAFVFSLFCLQVTGQVLEVENTQELS